MRKLENNEFPTKKTSGFDHCLPGLEQILDEEIESGIKADDWQGYPRQYLIIHITGAQIQALGVNFFSLQQIRKAAHNIYRSEWKVKLGMVGYDTYHRHITNQKHGIVAALRFYPKKH